jgi:hypothetical protein
VSQTLGHYAKCVQSNSKSISVALILSCVKPKKLEYVSLVAYNEVQTLFDCGHLRPRLDNKDHTREMQRSVCRVQFRSLEKRSLTATDRCLPDSGCSRSLRATHRDGPDTGMRRQSPLPIHDSLS